MDTKKLIVHGFSLIIASISFSSSAVDWFAYSPWEYRSFGYLGWIYSWMDNENRGNLSNSSLGGQIQVDSFTHGYIYRPWFTEFNFKGSLFANSRQFSLNTLEEQTIKQANVNLNVDLFNGYAFPISFEYNRKKDLLSGGISSELDVVETNVRGSYKPKKSLSKYSFAFRQRQNISTLDERNHKNNILNFNWDRSGDKHQWRVDTTVEKQTLQIRDNTNNYRNDSLVNAQGYLSYHWTPDSNRSISNLLSMGSAKNTDNITARTVDRVQLTSFATLMDSTNPKLRYTFNVLADIARNQEDVKQQVQANNIFGNAGVFFDINDKWTLSSNFNANSSEVSLGNKTTNKAQNWNLFTGLRYKNSWNFEENYTYGLSLTNNFRTTTTNSNQTNSYEASFDHNMTWSTENEADTWSYSVSQQLVDLISSSKLQERAGARVGHSFTIGWSSRAKEADSIAQFTISDSRHWNDNPESFQQANFQLSRRRKLDDTSGWHADLTAQWTQSVNEFEHNNRIKMLTGKIGYHDRVFFGNPRLSIRSNLSLPMDKYIFDNGERKNDMSNWNTVLSYQLGLLEVRAEVTFTDRSRYFRVEVRRSFGRF